MPAPRSALPLTLSAPPSPSPSPPRRLPHPLRLALSPTLCPALSLSAPSSPSPSLPRPLPRALRPALSLALCAPVFARNFRPATRGRGAGPVPSGGSATSSQLASYANQITRELTGGDWREGRASDEIVMDRFKRREMQFWGGRGRGRR